MPRAAGSPIGHIDAIDPLTGEKKWRVPLTDLQIWSATLSTGGGLLFTGKETGEFIALDADTGTQLWQFQTGSGINRSEEHTSELQSRLHLVCRLLLEKKKHYQQRDRRLSDCRP